MKTSRNVKTFRKLFLAVVTAVVFGTVLFPAAAHAAVTATLRSGQRKTYDAKFGKYYTFKFKAERTGYIEVYTTWAVTVQLRDNNGGVLSLVSNANSDSSFGSVLPSTSAGAADPEAVDAAKDPNAGIKPCYFAVKQGKTYRLKVLSWHNGKNRILYKSKSVSVSNNIYKSRAKRIMSTGKVKQQIYGKKTYWLSYKLSDDKDYKYLEIQAIPYMARGEERVIYSNYIALGARVQPEMALTIYSPHMKVISRIDPWYGINFSVGLIGYISGMEYLECGTYYFKVESKKKTNSGYIEFSFDRKS